MGLDFNNEFCDAFGPIAVQAENSCVVFATGIQGEKTD